MVLEDKSDRLVSERGEFFLSQLKWISSIEGDRTRRRLFQCPQDIKQGAFAGARRTHYGYGVTTLQGKRNTGKNGHYSTGSRILLGEVGDFKHGHV